MRKFIKKFILAAVAMLLMVPAAGAKADVTIGGNLSASRALTTIYTNTTGQPLIVQVSLYNTSFTSDATFECNAGASTSTLKEIADFTLVPDNGAYSGAPIATCTIFVPLNGAYQIQTSRGAVPTIYKWYETPYVENPVTLVQASGSTLQVDNEAFDFGFGILLFLVVAGFIASYFSKQIHG